ncbi:hypothetical protein QKW60_08655 [Defluviimonas aestuarii]|uniref:hypothetical protein n=1 Tax=Albidovulum aestuarii TaxID=1130726 RepID=UPI00249C8461|nr:hypothetical protein [Defluviimonas aestuarii]MDI3336473.1 hypothetical protein [Defluviimonas aestuarii]
MFPLNPPTVFQLVLVGVALSTALALRFGWRWRILFLGAAIALPTGFLWSDPPTGQYAGFAYLFVTGPSIATALLGAALGIGMRSGGVRPRTSIAVLLSLSIATAGAALWHQYVPSACLKTPLQVRIDGVTLHLPSELQPRLEHGDEINFFGVPHRKSSFARLCRMSENGIRAIEMDTVWITPAANHQMMTAACEDREPPAWCNSYSSQPYRRVGKVLIAPNTDQDFPLPYWEEGGSLKTDHQGDLIQGSVCLLPDAGLRTKCWVWQPFGDSSRLTISTNNLDAEFNEMPIEDAREMLRLAREMTLTIVKPDLRSSE